MPDSSWIAAINGKIVNKIDKLSGRTFLDLDHVHDQLGDIFLGHQEALILDDLSWAVELLDDFELRLRIHMQHEEELLLPIYESRRVHKTPMKGVGAEIYILEHKKMLELLANIETHLRDLASRCRCQTTPRDIIALLDKECTFKHLVEHHNVREHDILYAELDRITSQEERSRITERFTLDGPLRSGYTQMIK